MKLARYWTRGHGEAVGPAGDRIETTARGWSNESIEAARNLARDLAARVAARLASGMPAASQYEYGSRPLPEPVIRTFNAAEGEVSAVVTRNSYGAVVLNTAGLMFVDVDGKAKPQPRRGGFLSSLFGKPQALEPPPPDPRVDGFRQVAERNGLAMRVYETAAGYRLLVTNVAFRADSAETERLLREFGSDPLYIRLCRNQESFRARLTPKPWRCGHYKSQVMFPYEDPAEQSRFERWDATYRAKCAGYATCKLVASLGAGGVAREFGELIAYHDAETRVPSSLPLA